MGLDMMGRDEMGGVDPPVRLLACRCCHRQIYHSAKLERGEAGWIVTWHTVWYGIDCNASYCIIRLNRIGLDWIGLDWIGSDRIGSDRVGSHCIISYCIVSHRNASDRIT
jgi:hypothetical protein